MDLKAVRDQGIRRERKKRVGRGRGSGLGKTSGRGHKGAGSRSGYSMTAGFEGGQMPLYRRLPKRGFNNKRFHVHYEIVNVADLNAFDAGTEVNLGVLREHGLIKKNTRRVKVLGNGDIDRGLNVKVDKFSESAKQKIEQAGGQAEVTISIEGSSS